MKKNGNIAIFCRLNVGIRIIEQLQKAGANIVLVVTTGQDAEKSWFKELESYCRKNNITFKAYNSLKNNRPLIEILKEKNIVFALSIAFSLIFPKEIIAEISDGIVNFHPGLLPRFRGPHPVTWAIINGESETGVSAHYAHEKIDGGPVVATKITAIEQADTNVSLCEKLYSLMEDMTPDIFENWQNDSFKEVPQNEKEAGYQPKWLPENGIIDWLSMSAEHIGRLVRATLAPFPGARFIHDSRIFIVRGIMAGKIQAGIQPGKIIKSDAEGVEISCKNGSIILTEIHDNLDKPLVKKQYAGIFPKGLLL